VAVAGFFAQVVHGVGAAAARLVDHHEVVLREIVFFDRGQYGANEDVVAAAGTGVHHDFNWLARFKSLRMGHAQRAEGAQAHHDSQVFQDVFHFMSPSGSSWNEGP
jgi:hypothetical protein